MRNILKIIIKLSNALMRAREEGEDARRRGHPRTRLLWSGCSLRGERLRLDEALLRERAAYRREPQWHLGVLSPGSPGQHQAEDGRQR